MDSDEIVIKLMELIELSEDNFIDEITISPKTGTEWKASFLLWDSDNHLHTITVEKAP